MPKVYINAGHHNNDSGHVTVDGIRENDLVMKIRDKLVGMLNDAVFVSDDLDLRKSIDFINTQASEDDIAIDIHLNANVTESVRGAEAYYYGDSHVAEVISRNVAAALSIPNNGAIPDTRSWLGFLGWVRYLKCRAVIIECCYLTNWQDRMQFTPEKAALGIKNAIDELTKVEDTKVEEEYRGILLSMLAQVNAMWKAVQDYLKRRT